MDFFVFCFSNARYFSICVHHRSVMNPFSLSPLASASCLCAGLTRSLWQNARCCTSLQTAPTRPPAGLPADCWIEKANRVELRSQGGKPGPRQRSRRGEQKTVARSSYLKTRCCCTEEKPSRRCCDHSYSAFLCGRVKSDIKEKLCDGDLSFEFQWSAKHPLPPPLW